MPCDLPPAPMHDPDGSRRRRRRRYAGTHPRRYEQRYKELQPGVYPEIHARVRQRGGTPAGTHVPVLVSEVMACLDPRPGDIVVDCTLGYGGHAAVLLARIGAAGRLIGLDCDGEQLQRTRQRLAKAGWGVISTHRSNFAGLAKAIRAEKLDGVDVIFADLGVSSMQVDDPARGFSYRHDGPLDMRMDQRLRRTAADLLAQLPRAELRDALREFGDEPDCDRIADEIVRRRASRPIATTTGLVDLVFAVKGHTRREWRKVAGSGELHPAARVFQALRMLVNDELGALSQLLRTVPYCLRPGGRIGIISFHSGEDRLVKKAFREGQRAGLYEAVAEEVIRPSPSERRDNPRSSSAKLRWAARPKS